MKKYLSAISVVIAAALLAMPAVSQETPKHTNMQHSVATAAPSLVDGIVKKIDKSSGRVIVVHGPIANFNVPAMTKALQVKDSAWLDQLKKGETIRFMADELNDRTQVISEHASGPKSTPVAAEIHGRAHNHTRGSTTPSGAVEALSMAERGLMQVRAERVA